VIEQKPIKVMAQQHVGWNQKWA